MFRHRQVKVSSNGKHHDSILRVAGGSDRRLPKGSIIKSPGAGGHFHLATAVALTT